MIYRSLPAGQEVMITQSRRIDYFVLFIHSIRYKNAYPTKQILYKFV